MFLKNTENTAILYKDTEVSYSDFIIRSRAFSKLIDIKKGDRVAIFSENRLEWLYSFYGIWYNDGVVVPVDFMSTAEEVAYILNDCTPEVVFCSSETEERLKEAVKISKLKIKIIVFDNIKNIETDNITPQSLADKGKDQLAVIFYTSGTTGSPKGVMLSYENLETNIRSVMEAGLYHDKHRVLVLLPLHHVLPLVGTVLAVFYSGATAAISPSLNPADMVETLQKHKVTMIVAVPRFYNLIHKKIMDKINSSFVTSLIFKIVKSFRSKKISRVVFKKVQQQLGGHIDFCVSGGAALDKVVAKDMVGLGIDMLEGYGMTETAPIISFPRKGNVKLGALGQALPGVEVKVIDGEIIVKGKNVMQGYYKRPEETEAVLKDGWLHTGDLGVVDKKGFLSLTGRKKEIIVLGNGKNINPEEIEFKLVRTHDEIIEMGVFEKDGMLQAVIYPDLKVIRQKEIVNIEEYFRWEVIDKYNKSCTPYKKIMKFYMVPDELPKTRLGKLKRFELQNLVNRSTKNKKEIKEPDFKEYGIIKSFIENQSGREVYPDDHLELDLGMDSLDKVSFLVFIKSTFGIDMSEKELIGFHSVEDLAVHIEKFKVKINKDSTHWAEAINNDVSIDLSKSKFPHNFVRKLCFVFMKTYFRYKTKGIENLPESPYIIAPNHQSVLDGMFVMSTMKKSTLSNLYVFAKEKHFKKLWRRALARRTNIIIMDIHNNLSESLQKIAAVLKKGKNIMIFPEGTRSRTGQLGTFKSTFSILSKELNVPVVPVAISGADKAWNRDQSIPRPFKKVLVEFLKPVYPEKMTYDEIKDKVRDVIKENVKV